MTALRTPDTDPAANPFLVPPPIAGKQPQLQTTPRALRAALAQLKTLSGQTASAMKFFSVQITFNGRDAALILMHQQVSAFSTQAMVRLPIDASAAKPCAFPVEFTLLLRAAQALDPLTAVTLSMDTSDGGYLTIQSADDRQLLLPRAEIAEGKGPDTRDYTPALLQTPGPFITATAIALRTAIAQIAPAISKDETRFYLNGAYLETTETATTLTATNGHILHQAALTVLVRAGTIAPTLIPREIIAGLVNHLDTIGPQRHVTLMTDGERFMVGCADWWVADLNIDGTFPNYRHILPDPKHAQWTLQIDPAAWVARIDQAIQFQGPEKAVTGVYITLAAAQTSATLEADSTAITGSFSQPAPVIGKILGNAAEPQIRLRTNPHLLRAAVSTLTGVCTISIIDDKSPILLVDSVGAVRVVMPMRVER